MKILLATDGDLLKSTIAKRFGEAPYYLIYESETKKTEVRVNPGHDDNHSALIDLANEGILYYIIGNTGPNAFNVLNNLGAKLYLARGLVAEQALNYFLNNEIEPLTKATLKRPIREQ
ncbi:MAG: NifB/NifX family molybdenum-iron cluster-binding protein [Bacteroidales bacterium]|nr:NifB/NifX family molybdenum-iron cluster-binding protein [Bacteroidales bacterium]MDD3961523.1 NifB/NifX family molybdenum-iron cluster-binding protein [Bacteroidales bacterium]MDY0287103.1 NifB/NifX family molybdenum-iron cluster-binding protein [Bacteroidales bacterium]HPE87385.1 NifB/NifX family molybdenum-iron cluster-binding protein [Bacteroidales bacterium]